MTGVQFSPLVYVAAGILIVSILLESMPKLGGVLLLVLLMTMALAYERRGKVYVSG